MISHAIKLEAQLPANYESREMRLCLTRNGKKWAFGMFSDGYGVPLRSYPLHRATLWSGFKTRKAAAEFAKSAGFPPYAIWNAKKREYVGFPDLPPESRLVVHARNAGAVSWKGVSS